MWLATRSGLIFCSPTAGRTVVLSIGRDAGYAHGSVRILSQFAWVLIPAMAGVPIVGEGEAAMGRAGAGAVPSPLPRSTVFPASFAIPWPADRSLRGPAAQPRQRGQDALIRRVARYGLGRMGASAIPFTGQHAPAGPGAAPPLLTLSFRSAAVAGYGSGHLRDVDLLALALLVRNAMRGAPRARPLSQCSCQVCVVRGYFR